MPASFKFILAPRPDRDGLHDVRLRVIAARVVRYFNVASAAVAAKHWNEKYTLEKENWIKTSHFEHADINEALFGLLRRAQKLSRAQPTLSADELKRLLSTGDDLKPAPVATSLDFLAFCYQSYEREDVPAHSAGTCQVRQGWLDGLAAWWGWGQGARPLRLEQLTEQLVADYEAHLKRDLKNGPTTRRKKLDIFQLYVKRGVKQRLIPRDGNPLEYYSLPKPAPARVWLTEAELTALETVALPPQQHVARATYFIQYYLHGSRIGVVLRLQWKQRAHGAVRFVMDKGGREKLVQESPQLTALLDAFLPADGSVPDPEAFVLPWLATRYHALAPAPALQEMKRATAVVNMNLKRAGRAAGIATHFSSHSSRRTLADQADTITEDLGLVQGLLGHTTRAMTERYTQGRDTPAVHRGAAKVYEQRPMPQVKHR